MSRVSYLDPPEPKPTPVNQVVPPVAPGGGGGGGGSSNPLVDAETGEDMEESLTAEEVKAGILSGKYKPCTIDHIYHLFPKDKK